MTPSRLQTIMRVRQFRSAHLDPATSQQDAVQPGPPVVESVGGVTMSLHAGCQFKFVRGSERLAEIGAAPSIGTVGDSFDTLGCGGRLRIRREARTTLCDWRRIHTVNPTMSRMAPVVPRMGMPRTQPSAMTAIPKMTKMITVSRILLFTRLLRRLHTDGVYT